MSYERRRSYGGGFKPCPVEIGKEYEVDITETSRQGDGIARIQGFVIFVANTKPKDHMKIKITRIGRSTANAEIVK
ncbi:MAG: TRAM domain-containing protein [Desulfobacterales bacterium]|nr:TRAM domain-containing protein [Desulfobacterales bacterium]